MNILFFSYYFPPCGGAPVQRWLRFIPLLVKRGHKITVITSKDGDYPFIDHSLCGKIPSEVEVHRISAPAWEKSWKRLTGNRTPLPHGSLPKDSKGLQKLLIWLRLNLIIPDLRIFWSRKLSREALKILKSKPIDLIISTGPPHSTHLPAMRLAKKHGLPWLSDFRDPWTKIHYLLLNPPGAISRKIHSGLEREVLASADITTVISSDIAEALPEGKKIVVQNGFDPQDFEGLVHEKSDVFRIKYIGQFTQGQSLELLNSFLRGIERKAEVSFIGSSLSEEKKAQISAGLTYQPRYVEFLSHKEALKEMVSSDLLILIINRYEGNQGMLTTKLFEYLASRSPILVFAPPDNIAARIVRETDSGRSFDYHEIDEAIAWVESIAESTRNKSNIQDYSVEKQIDILDKAIQSLKKV